MQDFMLVFQIELRELIYYQLVQHELNKYVSQLTTVTLWTVCPSVNTGRGAALHNLWPPYSVILMGYRNCRKFLMKCKHKSVYS